MLKDLKLNNILQYAQWCNNIYNNIYPENLLTNYTKDGMDAWVIDNTKEIVIVFRGTNNILNVIQDVEMVFGLVPSHIEYVMDVFEMAVKYAVEKHVPIIVTGHSLGGSFAQYLSYRENIPAYCFNPYGIRNDIKNANISDNLNLICQNYCIKGDVVSGINMENQIGNVNIIDIPCDKPEIEKIKYLHAIQTIVDYFLGTIKNYC